ncbi:4Fe-4S dicluster domain-containing protein [Desulfosporosinus sp. SB140]|uniref:4Fe-4S dicluster domain-containing protein n=1 Tax=Desulfosporosinus paludis TaxID=3115649 RepID=UPI003890CBED
MLGGIPTVKQLGFVLDTNRCLGCGACVNACQLNNRLPSPLVYRSIRKVKDHTSEGLSQFFLSVACNHCANPECLRVCPKGAYSKRRDGIVIHSSAKCTGCKSCVTSCPFNVPKIHPVTGKASKCQLCYDRIDNGQSPYCIKACPTEALRLIELQALPFDNLIRLTAALPGLRLTNPSVYYKTPRRVKID